MSTLTTIWVCAGVGAGFAVAFAVLAAKTKLASNSFKAKPLLTANETEFLGRLETAIPEFRFHAQVAMGALIEPAIGQKQNAKEFFRMRGMFSQKIVDFVAQSRGTGEIVALIELDDRTHNAEKDAKRDAMTNSAGYRTVRWQSAKKPSIAAIRNELLSPRK